MAGQFMEGLKEWIKCGFDNGAALVADSLQTDPGDGVMAHTALPAIRQLRVNTPPSGSIGPSADVF
jgi:predicted esterase